MTGTVSDATGAVVSGAKVTLSNPSTGTKFNVVTDSKGSYRFANVPASPSYSVEVSRDGFSTAVIKGVALEVAITRTQDVKLLAGSNVQIEVSAASQAITLNTTDASIGNNFDVKLLNDLPVYDRANGITSLFTLQPGYSANGGTFAGARSDQNITTVDGMDADDIANGTSATVASPGRGIVGMAPIDSIEEFRGVITGMVSSIGTGSGAQFQLVTKSGTNKFHGDLNEYHRDVATVANDWFNDNVGIGRAPYIRNQFGGALGGPILKNKLFFFFDFNDSRIIQSANGEDTVPLDTYRNQTLGYILATTAGGTTCTAASRANTTPTCIGYLPNTAPVGAPSVASLDPQHIGFDQNLWTFVTGRYPHVNDLNAGDGVNTGGYRYTFAEPDNTTNYVARLDYNLTSKQQIFARGTVARENRTQAINFLPTDPITSPFINRSYSYVISHVWQIGNNKVNQFYYGDTVSELYFPVNYKPTAPYEYSFSGLSGPYSGFSAQGRRVPIPELRDDFNWQIKSHSLSFGGTFKFVKTNSSLTNDYSFVGVGLSSALTTLTPTLRPTGIRGGTTAPADYDSAFTAALGHVGSVGSNYNYNAAGQALTQGTGARRAYRFFETEAYLGDTWKINKQLTMTYGVRYQLYTVPYETKGAESVEQLTFDQLFSARDKAGLAGISGGTDTAVPFETYVLGGKANNGPNLYAPSYKDFAPRVAFAYNPSFLPKTVFNASAGIVYDRSLIDAIVFIQDQSSFLFQNSATNVYGAGGATAALATDPRIGGAGGNLTFGTATVPTAPAITAPYTPYVSGGIAYGGPTGSGSTTNVDPHLKDPYSIALNAGVQQQFQGNFILKINYAGRLGRRLLAQADASQVVEFIDPTSKQAFTTAMIALEKQIRAGTATTAVTPQPWFENVVIPGVGAANGYANNTAFVADNFTTLFQLGDIADFANGLSENGLIAPNVAVGAQFALDPWYTNKGFSTYNGLLVTLSKNLSHGLQFDANYTWSHSMDNVSAPANYIAAGTLINFICDANANRKCRGNSDFDIQQVFSSDFVAKLPVGRGERYLGKAPLWLDEAVGGWSLSGDPQWRSGYAVGALSGAFVAGFNEDAPPIFNGDRGALKVATHKTSSAQVQAFADPTRALAAFSGPLGLTVGSRNNLRGPSGFQMDLGLGKTFTVIPNFLNLRFRADAFNVLNHPVFNTQNADITSGSFGQISSTYAPAGQVDGARVAQFSLRLEF